jgi:hypothetical protein
VFARKLRKQKIKRPRVHSEDKTPTHLTAMVRLRDIKMIKARAKDDFSEDRSTMVEWLDNTNLMPARRQKRQPFKDFLVTTIAWAFFSCSLFGFAYLLFLLLP